MADDDDLLESINNVLNDESVLEESSAVFGSQSVDKILPKSDIGLPPSRDGYVAVFAMKKKATAQEIALAPSTSFKEPQKPAYLDSFLPPVKIEADKSIISESFDPYKVFAVRTPKISSQLYKERTLSKSFVPLGRLQSYSRDNHSSNNINWITCAVLIEKQPAKTSSNGKKYQIWKLGDLRSNSVSLFLFGNVFEKHWKESVGSVLVILNPKLIPSKNTDGFALELDHADKLMSVGHCSAFGFCRGVRKDGTPCTMPLDTRQGEHCEYHVVNAYKKSRSSRMEFNTGFGKPLIRPSMKAVTGFAGNDVSSGSFLFRRNLNVQLSETSQEKAWKATFGNSANNFSLTAKKTPAPVTRISSASNALETPARPIFPLPSNPIASPLTLLNASISVPSSHREATLAVRALLDNKTRTKETQDQKAMQQALNYVKQHGPLPMVDPNASSKAVVANDEFSSLKRKALGTVSEDNRDVLTSYQEVLHKGFVFVDDKDQDKKRKKRVLSSVMTEDELVNLRNATSINRVVVDEAEKENEKELWNSLEKEEKMIAKMEDITEILVRAVQCEQCHYLNERAHEGCKQRHPDKLKYVRCKKYFFECTSCRWRTTSLNSKLPTGSCKHCRGDHYKRISMMKDKAVETRGPFLARGENHGAFFNEL